MSNETETPAHTLAAATQQEVLPIHRMTLLGTFDKGDSVSALVRTPDGDIHMLHAGDTLGAATVTAIDMGALRLSVGQHSALLTIPEKDDAEPATNAANTGNADTTGNTTPRG